MSSIPSITVDNTGNSYVSYATVNGTTSVNISTVKRNTSGNVVWSSAYDFNPTITNSVIPSVDINQPIAPTFVSPATQTSAQVLVSWINPTQTQFNFISQPMPLIASMSVILNDNTNTISFPVSINANSPVSISGIAIIKGNGTSQLVGSVYNYYLSGATLNSPFSAKVGYNGYADPSTIDYMTIPNLSFATGGAPSAPQTVSVTVNTYSSASVSYGAPQYSDSTLSLKPSDAGAPTIAQYNLSYTPTASSQRYGGVYDTTPLTTTSAITSASLSSLYPDTSYSVAVTATNSLGSSGPSGTTTFATTENTALRPSYVDELDLSSFFTPIGTANLNYNGGSISSTPALIANTSGLIVNSSVIEPVGIHVSSNRGSSATGIMTLNAASGGSSTSLSVGGFGRSGATVTQNGITVTEASTADQGSGPTAGFYLTGSFNVGLTPVSEPQTLVLTQYLPGSTTKTSPTYTYYWDTLASGVSPSIGGLTASCTTTKTKVSGIPVVGTSWALSVAASSLSNMGSKLYVSDPITYSFAGSYGTLVSSFGTSVPTSLSSTSVSGTSLAYAVGPSVSVTATNINGLTGSAIAAIASVFDPASVALVGLTSTGSTPSIGSVDSVGQRIASPSALTSVPSSLAAFNNTTTLGSGTIECAVSQGAFCTKGFSGAFINYSSYGGPNYSNISLGSAITASNQYATFLWNGVAGNDAVSSLNIAITFTDAITLAGPTNNIVTLTAANGASVDVYYQVSTTGYTSTWINANSTVGSNSFNTTSKTLGSTVGGWSASSGSGTITALYTVSLPTPYSSTSSTIRVSVGLPSTSTTGVTAVTCAYA